jgi:hypothetical protein
MLHPRVIEIQKQRDIAYERYETLRKIAKEEIAKNEALRRTPRRTRLDSSGVQK